MPSDSRGAFTLKYVKNALCDISLGAPPKHLCLKLPKLWNQDRPRSECNGP